MRNYECIRIQLLGYKDKDIFRHCWEGRDMSKVAYAHSMCLLLSNTEDAGGYGVAKDLAASISTMAWGHVKEAMEEIGQLPKAKEEGGLYWIRLKSILSSIRYALEQMINPVTENPLDKDFGITEDVMKQIVLWETEGYIWEIPPGPITLKTKDRELLDKIFQKVLSLPTTLAGSTHGYWITVERGEIETLWEKLNKNHRKA